MGCLNSPMQTEGLTQAVVDAWDPREYETQDTVQRWIALAESSPEDCFWRLTDERCERLNLEDELDHLRTMLADVRRGIRTLDEIDA